MKTELELYLILLGVMSLILFILMGSDKRRARRHMRRISEKTLFLFALLGGAAGGLCVMHVFRHKTKHWYFCWGFTLLALAQCFVIYFLLR